MSFDTRSPAALHHQEQRQREQQHQHQHQQQHHQHHHHHPQHPNSLEPSGSIMTAMGSQYVMAASSYGPHPTVTAGVSTGVTGIPTAGPMPGSRQQQQQQRQPHQQPPPPLAMAPPSLSPLSLTSSPQRRGEPFMGGPLTTARPGATSIPTTVGPNEVDDSSSAMAAAAAAAHVTTGNGRSERSMGPVDPQMSSPPTISASSSISAASNDFRPQFSTQVDILMRTIQSRADETTEPKSQSFGLQSQGQSPFYGSQPTGTSSQEDEAVEPASKPFACTYPGCSMNFWQKTHLDIHRRSHTGEKPYVCSYIGCGAHFSQLGNLRTHERRHTGEKPFRCDNCGKFFAQRGNLKAHTNTHLRLQPYECRLDSCKKRFTQLGNMKAHQNKYHAAALDALTTKFARAAEGDEAAAASITQEERQLLQYFAGLYKNSNKGIKGRGKHRRVRPVVPKLPVMGDGMNSAPTFAVGSIPQQSSSACRTRSSRGSMREANYAEQQTMMAHPVTMTAPMGGPTSAESYMGFHPPLVHPPTSGPPVSYGPNLGKLVNGPADNGAGGNGSVNAFGNHHGQPPSLPPPSTLPPPTAGVSPYGSPASMTHGLHPPLAHPSHPGHQHPHGPMHNQPMHSIPSIPNHASQHGPAISSGPGGPHPNQQHHPGHPRSTAVSRTASTASFVSYDNEPVRGNGMYGGPVY